MPLERVLAKYPYIAIVTAPRFISKSRIINFLSESLLSKIKLLQEEDAVDLPRQMIMLRC